MFKAWLFVGLPLAVLPATSALGSDDLRRDPTLPGEWMPQTQRASDAVTPILSSVLIGADRRLAVIDGKLLAIGEAHGGFTVRQIEPDHVVVSIADGSRLTLLLDTHDMNKEVR